MCRDSEDERYMRSAEEKKNARLSADRFFVALGVVFWSGDLSQCGCFKLGKCEDAAGEQAGEPEAITITARSRF